MSKMPPPIRQGFAIRRGDVLWLGRGCFITSAESAFCFGQQKKAEESAVELAWENRGTKYEVFNMETFEKVASIKFSREAAKA